MRRVARAVATGLLAGLSLVSVGCSSSQKYSIPSSYGIDLDSRRLTTSGERESLDVLLADTGVLDAHERAKVIGRTGIVFDPSLDNARLDIVYSGGFYEKSRDVFNDFGDLTGVHIDRVPRLSLNSLNGARFYPLSPANFEEVRLEDIHTLAKTTEPVYSIPMDPHGTFWTNRTSLPGYSDAWRATQGMNASIENRSRLSMIRGEGGDLNYAPAGTVFGVVTGTENERHYALRIDGQSPLGKNHRRATAYGFLDVTVRPLD